jgi:membrane-associated protease RseP (regulator of RpoE activity)
VEEAINKVGMTLILSLVVFVTYNDIVRNFGEQIAKFFIK